MPNRSITFAAVNGAIGRIVSPLAAELAPILPPVDGGYTVA